MHWLFLTALGLKQTTLHIRQWTFQRLATKLGHSDKGSLRYLHVRQEIKFLHRYSKNNCKKRPPTTEEFSQEKHHERQSEQLGSRTRVTEHLI